MEEIKIDIKRTGFPVKVGEIELWFSTSYENLRSFFNVDEILKKKLKEAEEKAMHIHFPDDIEEYELEDFTEKEINNVDAALDVYKESIAAQYDIIFGDGTFKKIYSKYPDIVALEEALNPLGNAIAKRIEQEEQNRQSRVSDLKEEALKKQKAKQK